MTDDTLKPLSLALQGGGAHGAYTWGVLDRLLEEGRHSFDAVTATSAGAMNACAMAAGLHKGGAEGAREALETFWRTVSARSEALQAFANPWGVIAPWVPEAANPFTVFAAASAFASPYDLNPLDYNPLRESIEEAIDFDAVRQGATALFLSATNVETGRVRIFKTHEIGPKEVLASACLPQTFRAVEIDGVPYWDGGFLGNPSLYPLAYSDAPRDVLLVMLNPLERQGVPRTAAQIEERVNEISFNASLIGELRAIAFVKKLLDDGLLQPSAASAYKRLNVHAIRGGRDLSELTLSTKYKTDWAFLKKLRDIGRLRADAWLSEHEAKVGTGQSTVDIQADFLGR